MSEHSFRTNVVTGTALLALSENVLLFGLRRTGKTTILRQTVLDMTPENAAQTAYNLNDGV